MWARQRSAGHTVDNQIHKDEGGHKKGHQDEAKANVDPEVPKRGPRRSIGPGYLHYANGDERTAARYHDANQSDRGSGVCRNDGAGRSEPGTL